MYTKCLNFDPSDENQHICVCGHPKNRHSPCLFFFLGLFCDSYFVSSLNSFFFFVCRFVLLFCEYCGWHRALHERTGSLLLLSFFSFFLSFSSSSSSSFSSSSSSSFFFFFLLLLLLLSSSFFFFFFLSFFFLFFLS